MGNNLNKEGNEDIKKEKKEVSQEMLKELRTKADLLEKILGRKPSVCPDCGCPLIHNCLHPPLLHI